MEVKSIIGISNSTPHIWSSVTLYNESSIKRRKLWFNQWLDNNLCPDQDSILAFHLFGGDGDAHNDLRMNRNNQLLTVSLTCSEIKKESALMKYHDLYDNSIHVTAIDFL
jgi:hypothetical protein